jgi:hypothetical protein
LRDVHSSGAYRRRSDRLDWCPQASLGDPSTYLRGGPLSTKVVVVAAARVLLAALLPVERRLRAPMLRLSLFLSRQFDALNVAAVLLYGALGAASYLVIL